MGNPLYALFLAVAGILLPEGLRPEGMTQPTITISPKPPVVGGQMTVTYTGTLPATLSLSWTPDGAGPATIEIGLSGTASITVPAADSVSVIDPTGAADARSTSIES